MNVDAAVMSLKARMRNRAREISLPPHVVLQNYAFERFLARLAVSPWREKLVIKGGLLIAQLHGLAARSTMDMDATLRDAELNEETALRAVSEICSVDADDGFEMRVVSCETIRETDLYGGFRIHFDSTLGKMAVHLSVDLSTGDAMTPAPVEYVLSGLFSPDAEIRVFGYNRETILAEKLESILSLGVYGTRPRDYYDVWLLTQDCIEVDLLREAFRATCRHRGTESLVSDGEDRLRAISESDALSWHWKRYARQFPYAKDLSFSCVVDAVRTLYRQAAGRSPSPSLLQESCKVSEPQLP